MVNNMPDLQEKLNQILSNPEALKQVQSLGQQLGLTSSEPPPPKSVQMPISAPPTTASPPNNLLNGDMMKIVSKLAPLMNSANGEDDTTRLLHSLRPFLSHERQEKLDKAEKMLRLIRLVPILKSSGLLL
jgi:hypothetical protein